MCNYVYLDSKERRRFAHVGHEYLIDQLQYAQQTKSVGAAMGFTGIGFGGFKQDQTRVSYGAGGTRAILGPGFR